MKSITTSSWLPWLLISSGCVAAPEARKEFRAPADLVREAVHHVLRPYPDLREKEGRFETGWSREFPRGDLEGFSADPEEGFLKRPSHRYRIRHTVRVEGTAVEVRSSVERRASAGPRAIRWETVDPAAAERGLLEEIGKELEWCS